jgi:hypothetical protein
MGKDKSGKGVRGEFHDNNRKNPHGTGPAKAAKKPTPEQAKRLKKILGR